MAYIAFNLAARLYLFTCNYINDERFLSRYEYFCDYVHLNAKGSTLFSEIFAKDLKNLLDGRKN